LDCLAIEPFGRSDIALGTEAKVHGLLPSPGTRHIRKDAVFSTMGVLQPRRLHVTFQGTGLELANPDPDQLPRIVVSLRQRVQRLTSDEFFSNLPCERGAVRSIPRHGFHAPEAQQ
jgi:hypothetical protein